MSVLVDKFSIIALLIIGLPLSGGNHGDNEKSVQSLDFQQAPPSAKDELKLRVECSQMMELQGQLHTNIQSSKDTKHEQRLQTHLTETERKRIENQPETYVKKTHHLLNEHYAIQNPKLSTDAKKCKNIKHNAQLHTPVEESQKVKLGSQIPTDLQKTWVPKEDPVPSLWKRARGQFFVTQPSKKNLQKTESRKTSDPPSKGKVNTHLASNIPSTVKHKNKLAEIFSYPFAKPQKQSSVNKQRSNSKTEGLSKRLTSGYVKKPSGVGQVSEYAPSAAAFRSQLTQSAKPDDPYYGVPYERPAESSEINQLWDFINNHSRQWSNSKESPLSFSYKQTPAPAGTKHIDSRSPAWTADTYQNGNRYVSPSKRQTPSSQPEPLMSRNAGARVSDSKGDKDALHLIKRHRKGWQSSQGVPADHTSPSSDEDLSRKAQSPLQSFHKTIAPSNTEKTPRQRSNKELDNEYNAYITRVRSREGQESK